MPGPQADGVHGRSYGLALTTLTSMGYGDITRVGQPAYSLTWTEVMLGQFYMAVVVAQ